MLKKVESFGVLWEKGERCHVIAIVLETITVGNVAQIQYDAPNNLEKNQVSGAGSPSP